MAFSSVRIYGLDELRAALKLVSLEAPKELAKTNQVAGQIVADEAIRRAPKGRHQGGGEITPISESIRATKTQAYVAVVAGGRGTPHAVVTEFGGTIPRAGEGGRARDTRGRRRQHGGRVTRVRQQAYLYPAAEAKLPEVEEAYLGMIETLLEEFEA